MKLRVPWPHGLDHPDVFVVLTFSVVFAQLGFYLTGAALPLYMKSVGTPTARIGLDLGVGSLATIALTLGAGWLLNRGATARFLMAGSACYVLASLVMLIFPVEAAITVARLLQGAGLAILGPAAYSAIPRLTSGRVGSLMGIIGTAGSVPLAIGPAVGLLLYQRGGAAWLLLPSMAVGVVGFGLGYSLRMPPAEEGDKPGRGFGYRWVWTGPLAANGLNGVYFGGILAYLSLYLTHVHGPNAGLFFTADAVGVVILRIPAGMLADRTVPAVPMILGLAVTLLGLAAFLGGPGVIWLLLAGAGTGIGAGLMANGVLTDLSNLSTETNRGTAMALSVATISLGVFLGSSVGGLIYHPGGFLAIILFGAVAEAIGIPCVLATYRASRLAMPPEPAVT